MEGRGTGLVAMVTGWSQDAGLTHGTSLQAIMTITVIVKLISLSVNVSDMVYAITS